MLVIVMTRSLGTLDHEVAEQTAQALGLRTAYGAVIDDIRRQSRSSPEAVSRIVEGRAGRFERWRSRAGRFDAFARSAAFSQASEGAVVIRGWGAPLLFAHIPQVIKVHIVAPMESRVRNLKRALNTDDEALIRREIRRSDFSLAATLGGGGGDSSALADLVLNTEKNSVAQCVEKIAALTRSSIHQATPESVAALKKQALLARVRAGLELFGAVNRIEVLESSQGDGVVLRGMVRDKKMVAAIEDVVTRIAGIGGVSNQLRPMYGHRRINGVSNF